MNGRGALLIGSIASILLFSFFGVRGAWRWYASANADNAAETRLPAGELAADTGALTAQADGQVDILEDTGLPLSRPLVEAGSYVQRQQRVGEDAAIAGTPVAVSPAGDATAAANNATAAQGNTTTGSAQAGSSNSQPSSSRPVNALW